MKLLLVSAAQLQDDGTPLRRKKAFLIPLSVYLLAGMTPRDWQIEIANEYTDEIDYQGDYDLVGITLTTLHSQRGYEIARRFRENGKKVVLGGFHPTLFTEETRRHADSVVVGEAELVWERLLDDARHGRLQPVYQADRLCDMKNQPVPRYDLIDQKKYLNNVFPAESTRGCPYNCDYCSVTTFYGHKYRFRPVDEVARDIRASGSRFIGFVDDNIAGKLEYSAELYSALIPLKIFWMSQVSIRLADDERVLALAARSGYRYAVIGIETLDKQNLEAVGKKNVNQVDEYVAKTKLFKKYGITVCTNLMFGFDNDTPETFTRTFDFVRRNCFMVNPYILTPYPGTRLYDRMEKDGRLLHKDYWRYTSYQTVFRPKGFTPPELDRQFMDFYRKCYDLPFIARRFYHGLSIKRPWGSFMTQVAVAINSLAVRYNLQRGILPYF
ncbi:MAG: B12-binding domain-containing radical SAM protein [Myxococcales bacterium]|nr:B12-binding domain-containing radical SAM protein [Myxococcales bacterium]